MKEEVLRKQYELTFIPKNAVDFSNIISNVIESDFDKNKLNFLPCRF